MYHQIVTTSSVVISGAASGIGRATALSFAESGSGVVLGDVDVDRLRDLAREITEKGGRVLAVEYDASAPQAATELAMTAVTHFGQLNAVVAAAGIYAEAPALEMDPSVWDRTLAVNLSGPFFLAQASARVMSSGGAVVLVSSVAGRRGGSIGHSHYGASKGGIDALVKGLAREWWPQVRVNGVAPGLIDTPMTRRKLDALKVPGPLVARQAGDVPPPGPVAVGQPSQVASVIRFLCSSDAEFVTGEILAVAGDALLR